MRTVVVTGCTRGLGKAFLEFCSKSDGVKMVIGIGREGQPMNDLRVQYKNEKDKVKLFIADVRDVDALKSIAEELAQQDIIPDFLLNNAAVLGFTGPVWLADSKGFLDALHINVVGVNNVLSAFVPLMRDVKGAAIVNVSSLWGRRSDANVGVYNATKFAVEGLTGAAAKDLENFELSICTVSPGIVQTDMLNQAGLFEMGTKIDEWIETFPKLVFAVTKEHSGKQLTWPDDVPK
jgi:NAD(P)-dependent dehydrogenase (short-subunit alcohol dehydrogenase family)